LQCDPAFVFGSITFGDRLQQSESRRILRYGTLFVPDSSHAICLLFGFWRAMRGDSHPPANATKLHPPPLTILALLARNVINFGANVH